MDKHLHAAAANTIECFSSFKGCTVRGVIYGGERNLLIFECGYALAFYQNGSYSIVGKVEVRSIIDQQKKLLQNTTLVLKEILKLADEPFDE